MKRSAVGDTKTGRWFYHVIFVVLISFYVILPQWAYAGQIELAGEGFIPDPNQEITVWVQTDASLYFMGLGIEIIGDATITGAMCEADCNDFGWNNGWNSDPYIDPNGWVYLSGVAWPNTATGTVGYVTFQYHSGQVAVSIFDNDTFDSNCLEVPASDKVLIFGQPDPNETESIEELSNPLGSRILESKTYRITTLPLEIEGHVVIPAGAKLIAPYDPNNAIIEVMPGGLLDMGKAASYSESDCPAVLPPVEIDSEDPNFIYEHNFIGIYIHRGANPSTRICNTVVNNCTIGITADEALTNPFQNVITFGFYNGIWIFAPNVVADSEFWPNGSMFDEIFAAFGVGIYVHLDGIQYSYPSVSISRSVMCYGDFGIYT